MAGRTSRKSRRNSTRLPSLQHHKARGLAVVSIDGRDVYCGRWGTREAEAEYRRVVAEWLVRGEPSAGDHEPQPCATVAELADAYLDHAAAYYRDAAGKLTPEYHHICSALAFACRLYLALSPCRFDTLKLKAVRQAMIDAGLSRTTINQHVGRLKRCWLWAEENRLVSPLTGQQLRALRGLRRGRGGVEPVRRQPVDRERVDPVRPHVDRRIWAMIELQWHSGMRSGEVCGLRTADIEMGGDVWLYRPARHKTQWLGRDRVVALGPICRRILRPWLRADLEAYLFSPAEADAERRARQVAEREARGGRGSNKPRKSRPRKRPGTDYTPSSYRRRIVAACDAAGIPPWCPHQLRHAFATRAASELGGDLDAVAAALGHASIDATKLYAKLSRSKAADVARRIG